MNRKSLLIIIAVLSVILVAGIALIVVDMVAPMANERPTVESPAEATPNENAEEEKQDLAEDILNILPPATSPWENEEIAENPQESVGGQNEVGSGSEQGGQENTGGQMQTGDKPTEPTQGKPGSPNTAESTTEPTQKPTEPTQQPTAPSYQQPTTPEGDPIDDATVPNLPEDVEAPESGTVTYEDYANMSAEEQIAFFDSFDSVDAFFTWYNAAKKAYEDSFIEIDGTTPIDLDELLGGN